MRHGNRSRRLSLKSDHRGALLKNLAAALVEHGRIKTTSARAKVLRPYVEKLVTKLKDPTVANIRYVRAKLPTKSGRDTVNILKDSVAPAFKTRPGGYLRILKLARPRVGDKADMSFVEWVDDKLVKAYQAPTEKVPAKKGGKKKKAVEAAPTKSVGPIKGKPVKAKKSGSQKVAQKDTTKVK